MFIDYSEQHICFSKLLEKLIVFQLLLYIEPYHTYNVHVELYQWEGT